MMFTPEQGESSTSEAGGAMNGVTVPDGPCVPPHAKSTTDETIEPLIRRLEKKKAQRFVDNWRRADLLARYSELADVIEGDDSGDAGLSEVAAEKLLEALVGEMREEGARIRKERGR